MFYFASQLKKIRPEIGGLVAFGTDGEEALSSAFSSVYPSSVHLLCFVHKRDNIVRKLREFQVKDKDTKQILNDIFGSVNEATQFPGLVDSCDSTEFSEKFKNLKPKWELICPAFVKWFLKYEVEMICSCMTSSVRTQAGLGKPPKRFTTNANESFNSILKRRVDFKRSEWPRFNKVMKDLAEEQQAEFEKAVSGKGEYELADEFKYLDVSHLNWILMSPEQQKGKIEKAAKAKYSLSIGIAEGSEKIGMADGSEKQRRSLGINFTDVKVGDVSKKRLSDMWDKAEELLSTPNFVLPCAGATLSARQVASLSSFNIDPPHFVTTQRIKKDGTEVKCDCPVYRSSPSIYQHALAAAEDMDILPEYLRWVSKTKKSANLSQLIADALPKSVGRKSTSRRKGGSKGKTSSSVADDTPSDLASARTPRQFDDKPPPMHLLCQQIKVAITLFNIHMHHIQVLHIILVRLQSVVSIIPHSLSIIHTKCQ